MGFPRYNNVQKVDGEGMSFETYLKQINLLYPNLPDLYLKYLRLVIDFHAEQFERMYEIGELDVNAEMFNKTLESLIYLKEINSEDFLAYADGAGFTEAVKNIFEIAGGLSFEEWLALIDESMFNDPDFYFNYLMMMQNFIISQKEKLNNIDEITYTFINDFLFQNDIMSLQNYFKSLGNSLRTATMEFEDADGNLQIYQDYKYSLVFGDIFSVIQNSLYDDIFGHPENKYNKQIAMNAYYLLQVAINYGDWFKNYFEDDFNEQIEIPGWNNTTLKEDAIELFGIEAGGGTATGDLHRLPFKLGIMEVIG